MQKKRNKKNGYLRPLRRSLHLLPLLSLACLAFVPAKKVTVEFYSADSLLITADDYFISDSLPYLILLHEQGSSRGEFNNIADRFQKMDYNCLAVDLRNGGNSNFISNETAKRCRRNGLPSGVNEIEADIKAAIAYATKKTGLPVVLLGAGANASIAMKLARENAAVRAVVALSTGEYFRPRLIIRETVAGLEKPVLILTNQMEYPYVEELASGISNEYKTIFKPEEAQGSRGSRALLSDNPTNSEYWLSLLIFFKDLK